MSLGCGSLDRHNGSCCNNLEVLVSLDHHARTAKGCSLPKVKIVNPELAVFDLKVPIQVWCFGL
jgi:hypothetical protein